MCKRIEANREYKIIIKKKAQKEYVLRALLSIDGIYNIEE